MLLDGVVDWRIPTRHHRRPLLLPMKGDPELDRYWVAQMAREALVEDWQRRNRALQREMRRRPLR